MSLLLRWLNLSQVPGLGARRMRDLIPYLHDPLGYAQARCLSGNGARSAMLEAAWTARAPISPEVERILTWAEGTDRHILPLWDERYPPLLKEIPDPPAVLHVLGDTNVLRQPQLAMVGTRKPSPGARQGAEVFARAAVERGLTVTSGLALGVDGLAHAAALDARGRTIAVLGGGVSCLYPRQHAGLAERILAGQGAVISEMPPDTPATARLFPRRNRIISGLSLATLVVEAGEKSGSLITARLAAEQGRDVCVLPGHWQSPQARGSNRLIKQGARPVDCPEDLDEDLAGWLSLWQSLHPESPAGIHPAETREHRSDGGDPECAPEPALRAVLEAIGYTPTPLDVLVQRSGRPAECLAADILRLELEGWVASVPGGVVRAR